MAMAAAVATLRLPIRPTWGRKATASHAARVAGLQAVVLMAERQADVGTGTKLVQGDGVVGQLEADHGVAVVAGRVGRVGAAFPYRPRQVPLGAHGQLPGLGVRR